ncbi:MAG: tetratricopeptide repeat protein [Candidatus Methylomirabilales bacterium]
MRIKRRRVKSRPEGKDLTQQLYDLRRPLTIGVVAALLMIGAWWGYRTVQSRQEEAAQVLLARALESASEARRAAEGEEAKAEMELGRKGALPVLVEIREQYASSRAAEQALLQMGDISYRLGHYQDALGAYQEYLEEYPRGWAVVLAGLGKAYAMEAGGQYKTAASIFRHLADRYQAHGLAPEALMGLARCVRQVGGANEAQAVYQRLITDYPATRWARQAEENLAILDREGGESGG